MRSTRFHTACAQAHGSPALARPRRAPQAQADLRSPGRRTRCGGFSLVEVLVAVAIVAVALAAGSRAAGALLNNAQRLSDVMAAQWCADNRLVGLKLAKLFPDVGDSSFECIELGQSYRGALRVQATLNPNFRRVDASVATADGTPLVTLSTVLPRY